MNEESIQQASQAQVNVPMLVKIFAILMLLNGVGYLLIALPLLLFVPVMGWLVLASGISVVITSFGIRKLKKWALYVFTAASVLVIGIPIYSLITSGATGISKLAPAIMQVVVLVYFWSIFKKFS